MTDQRSLNLLQASFKGVNFLTRNESESGGPRLIFHEYPNSNSRYIERIGTIPSEFTIEAFVHGPRYLENLDTLRNVINSPGTGTLVLPVLGTFQNVQAAPFDISASQTEVGIVSFNLSFALSRPVAGPLRGPTIIQDVSDEANNFRFLAALNLEQLYVIVQDAATLISSASDLKLLTQNTLDILSRYVDTPALSKVLQISSRLIDNPGSYVTSGVAIGAALFGITAQNTGLWSEISVAIPNGDGLEGALQVTNIGTGTELNDENIFGSDTLNDTIYDPSVSLWPETTVIRQRRNRNRLSTVNAFRIGALMLAYEQAAARDYKTAQEIVTARNSIELAYQRLFTVSSADADAFQSNAEMKEGFENLRNASLDVLKQKEQNANRLVDYTNLASTNAFGLAYKLYGEDITEIDELLTRALEIRNLNPEQTATNINGTVSVIKQ